MAKRTVVTMKWFEGKGRVGVVLTKTQSRGYLAYIGVALDVNEEYDADFITQWGSKISFRIAQSFFPRQLDFKEKSKVKYHGRTYQRPEIRTQ